MKKKITIVAVVVIVMVSLAYGLSAWERHNEYLEARNTIIPLEHVYAFKCNRGADWAVDILWDLIEQSYKRDELDRIWGTPDYIFSDRDSDAWELEDHSWLIANYDDYSRVDSFEIQESLG